MDCLCVATLGGHRNVFSVRCDLTAHLFPQDVVKFPPSTYRQQISALFCGFCVGCVRSHHSVLCSELLLQHVSLPFSTTNGEVKRMSLLVLYTLNAQKELDGSQCLFCDAASSFWKLICSCSSVVEHFWAECTVTSVHSRDWSLKLVVSVW